MITACRLNNKNMRGIRRSEEYQCVMVDLAMLGVISKEECEMLIGGSIPKNLTLPNGKQGHLISESNLPKQPVQVDGDGATESPENGVTQESSENSSPVQTASEGTNQESSEGDSGFVNDSGFMVDTVGE